MRLLLFGAPGSGKSTQSEFLQQRFGIPKISTGDILREEARLGTDVGHLADVAFQSGQLVDDGIMITMINRRLGQDDAREGYLLDGFPRTLAQAEALEPIVRRNGGGFDRVIHLDLPPEEIVRRLSGRLHCPTCGRTYNLVSHPPNRPGRCDFDATALEPREDDDEATALNRIEVYQANTLPALDFYRRQDLVSDIDSTSGVEEVRGRIELAALQAVKDRR